MTRRILLAFGIVAVIVTLAFAVQRLVFSRGDDSGREAAASAPTPDPSARAVEQRIVIREVSGTVERRGADGQWRPLASDDAVNPNDQIRTAPGSTARLEVGDLVSVVVAEQTELNVAELSSTLSRIRLEDGRIVSEVRGGHGYRFRVQVKGSDAVAETGSGKFAVLRRGEGSITVAAEEGSVNVSAQDQGVRVEAGEQSVVAPGAPPSPPTKLPTSLLLKLGKPPPSRTRKTETNVSGETNPGATVVINGVASTVGPDGKFTRVVTLREGSNDIVVVVEDAVGRHAEAQLPEVTVDSRAPRVRGNGEW